MAVGDAHVFPGILTPVLTQLSFQGNRLLFSHASAEVRGKNTPERKIASIGSQTHNRQVMSPTHTPFSHLGGVKGLRTKLICLKRKISLFEPILNFALSNATLLIVNFFVT